MDATWSPKDLAFQEEVRAFFKAKLTPEIRRAGSLMTSVYADHELALKWQRILHAQGWAAPAWPVEHGGCGWTPVQHYIFARERIAAGAPPVSPMGVGMVAYVIMAFGTPEQKDYFLPRTLRGDILWCQGYSEPNSGSDLASLQMRAVEDGDDLICTGSKIWTTHAHVADWIFCLVRTSTEARQQQGITFLLIDMKSPGIVVKPIIMLSGEHIQNQIFFDEVRVPKANVLGEIGQGWSVAKYLLDYERGGSAYAPGLRVRLDDIAAFAGREPGGMGASLVEDSTFAAKLSEAQIRLDALEALEFRVMSDASHGRRNGASASMMKVLGTELSQHITELALEAAAAYALPFQPHAAAPGGPTPVFTPPKDGFIAGEPWQAIAPLRYLNDRVGTIYAGTNEIQRNIMTKMVLGL
ncbi:MAG: acyl-CoA dehydrogenase family protein [Hydrogenophilaceae bacterium]|jgi:alkylation response protein AidB-like acyl-CoA dehydrogenase|nr:acyl-CoA dehydrogenase family protein [Hydrogenophilaceae bacterium]